MKKRGFGLAAVMLLSTASGLVGQGDSSGGEGCGGVD